VRALPALLVLMCCQAPPEHPLASLEQANATPIVVSGLDADSHFGFALAPLASDGGTLLAVGAPGAAAGVGAVFIFQATSDGQLNLVKAMDAPQTMGLGGVTPQSFGAALASADFNGDGLPDLAVGGPKTTAGIININLTTPGDVWVYKGVADGGILDDKNPVELQNASTLGLLSSGTSYGGTLAAAAAFDMDSLPDLLVGMAESSAKTVYVFRGNAALVAMTPFATVSCPAAALTSTDIDGDGRSDVLGGDPNAQSASPYPSEGVVAGTTASGAVYQPIYGQAAGGMLGAALIGIADINGDNVNELAVGGPGFDSEDGVVEIFTTIVAPLQKTFSINGPSGEAGMCGAAVAASAELNGKTGSFLFVGCPAFANGGKVVGYDISDIAGAGAVKFGPFTAPVMDGANFGKTLLAGYDFNGDHIDDLVVGAPDDSPDSVTIATGSVFLFLGDAGAAGTPDGGPGGGDAGMSGHPDGGSAVSHDGGAPDAGFTDGGPDFHPDAGRPDAGTHDGGQPHDGGTVNGDAGTTLPDAGTIDQPVLDFIAQPCGCDAGASGAGLALVLLLPARRRARADRGASRTRAPRSAAPRRS
jgi:hypothetical protein